MKKRIRLNLSVDTSMADGMRELAERVGIRTLNKLNKVILRLVLSHTVLSSEKECDEGDEVYIERMFGELSDSEGVDYGVRYVRKRLYRLDEQK